jgi:nucleoside-diphosphate-sugar epimerase
VNNILVTGACGYKGSVLVPKLLSAGYIVTAVDTQWFGNFVLPHKNLTMLKQDVRYTSELDLSQTDVIIHLASVANDPCGDLDPKLTWEISALATQQLADKAVRQGVKHFIYASSGSVYGVKSEQHVTEDLLLEPISEYNKTKMVSERVLLSYSEKMAVQIVRPATVCGLSSRMRLDVAVNMLTMQAVKNGKITVFGGDQSRPNIHIDDITDLYMFLLEKPEITGVYNAGFENITIAEIADIIAKRTGAVVVTSESNDPRSYRVNSDKLLATGFKPKKCVENAIEEIIAAYQKGDLVDEARCYNLKWMQEHVL